MSRKLITTISMASTLAAVAVVIPVAAADGGPPQGGGGCHMVSSPSPNTNMMDGSAHGAGAANMVEMLSRFSCGS